jgi:hypothetical protein
MQLRAKLSSVDGKAPTSQDGANKIGLKFSPLYLGERDASWLFDHLGEWLTLDIGPPLPPPPTPMEEAIEVARNGHVEQPVDVSTGRRRRGTRANPTEDE